MGLKIYNLSVQVGISCLLLFMPDLVAAIGARKTDPKVLNAYDTGLLDIPYCFCQSTSSCLPRYSQTKDQTSSSDKQVIVISDGDKSWEHWRWDVITTVISNGPVNKDLMCYTHAQKKYYGFVARPDNSSSLVNGSEYGWITDIIHQAHTNFADILAIDFLDILNEPELNITHLRQVVHSLKYSIDIHSNQHIKLMCFLPWKPPGSGNDFSLTQVFADNCDMFMTEPRSYLTIDLTCRATATVPFTKLILGVDEFVARGVAIEKFYLAIPWHGYDYTCHHYEYEKSNCYLSEAQSTSPCDYRGVRKQMKLGDMVVNWPNNIQKSADHHWHRFNMAPYFEYNKTNETSGKEIRHQVWFEDIHSLSLKYHFVRELDMAGVAIWSVDDLRFEKEFPTNVYDKTMWNMLKDAMFKPHENFLHDQMNSFPSKMAGVGVGCMLLGTVLGFVLGIVVCRRQKAGKLNPPFTKDRSPQHDDDYTDDPHL